MEESAKKVTKELGGASLGDAALAGGAAVKAGTIATGAVAYEGVRRGFNAISDPGFLLFIFGMISFLADDLIFAGFKIIFGVVFMVYSAYFIFEGKGFIATGIFIVWYFMFGGIADPLLIIQAAIPVMLTGMLLHGFLTKLQHKGGFAEGAIGEMIALVPIVIFFLDLGLIELLTQQFGLPLTSFVQNLILYTPWWGLLGLFTTKKENMFISVFKMVGIMYVFLIFTFGIVPVAYSEITAPTTTELLKAREDVRAQIPKGENPAISNIMCLLKGQATEYQGCVEERQKTSRIKQYCIQVEKHEEGTAAYKECFAEEEKKRNQPAANVAGRTDPTIKEPTKAAFKADQYFPKTKTYRTGDSLRYPIQFMVENPRDIEFSAEFGCNFTDSKKKKDVEGRILQPEEVRFGRGRPNEYTVICEPQEEINSTSVEMNYWVDLKGLDTFSLLSRVFVGELSHEERSSILSEINQQYFRSNTASRTPADLARLNFAIGSPLEKPIIEKGNTPSVAFNIKNHGGGQILAINTYRIELGAIGVDNPACLSGSGQDIHRSGTGSSQIYTGPLCLVTGLPDELENPEGDYAYRELEAYMNYDYRIIEKITGMKMELVE